MVHREAHALLGFCSFPGQAQRAVTAVEPQGQQDAAGVAAGAAGVVR